MPTVSNSSPLIFLAAIGHLVAGTTGVLVLTNELVPITSVGIVLSDLRAAGLYLSEAVIETFLHLADE